MQKTVFKYRINELLTQLSVKDYRKALLVIPQLLNISPKTFNNYRKIKFDDVQDIPHEKVVLLEKLFDINAGELQNYTYILAPIKSLADVNQPVPLRKKRKLR